MPGEGRVGTDVLGTFNKFVGPGRTRANFVYLSDTLSTRTAK